MNRSYAAAAAAARAAAAVIVADARLSRATSDIAGNIPSFGGGTFRVEAGKISRAHGVPFRWALRVLCRRIAVLCPSPAMMPDGDWAWYHEGAVWSAPGYIGRAVASCMEA